MQEKDKIAEIIARNRERFLNLSEEEVREIIVTEFLREGMNELKAETTAAEIFRKIGLEAQAKRELEEANDVGYQEAIRKRKEYKEKRIAEIGKEAFDKEEEIAYQARLQAKADRSGYPQTQTIDKKQVRVFHPGKKEPTIETI
ncbi:MAG: hypothetical protein FWE79_02315 [Firmicutes bacterium]|nr:hypothetical protein [Bacillota bacterium]